MWSIYFLFFFFFVLWDYIISIFVEFISPQSVTMTASSICIYTHIYVCNSSTCVYTHIRVLFAHNILFIYVYIFFVFTYWCWSLFTDKINCSTYCFVCIYIIHICIDIYVQGYIYMYKDTIDVTVRPRTLYYYIIESEYVVTRGTTLKYIYISN